MLLNNIKIKHQASQIVALDWGKGVAVVELPSGGGWRSSNSTPQRFRSRDRQRRPTGHAFAESDVTAASGGTTLV
jgi:hypothetical protein